ncbi:tetraacyldisaccharide 4'-kinase [Orrella marina]|nr:tetraacyldisaccharide 4'-kinase [Orrella marina]
MSQWQKRGLFAWLMFPLSLVYRIAGAARRKLYSSRLKRAFKARVPVIVVGNIYVGGTGKTPVILSLLAALTARGWRPGLVSRGYGSRSKRRPLCGQGTIDAAEFGDEPAMISMLTGISVSVFPDRALAVEALLDFDPAINVILSDDGLQHWALARDIEILVQDERGCGNGLTLPAGPLREPPARMLEVDAVLTRQPHDKLSQRQSGLLDESTNSREACPGNDRSSHPVVHARFAVVVDRFRHLATGRELSPEQWVAEAGSKAGGILAIAGIGVPERFFANLRSLGVNPDRTLALPDHGDIDKAWLARQAEGTILMTEKDAVKLVTRRAAIEATTAMQAAGPQTDSVHDRIWVATARTAWCDDSFFDWVETRLQTVSHERLKRDGQLSQKR